MAVIYLFDNQKQLKTSIKDVSEIIHNEGERTAIAQLTVEKSPDYGDFFGFRCIDGKFRMFLITFADIDDESGTCSMTGTDAAVAELQGKLVRNLELMNRDPQDVAEEMLTPAGWELERTDESGNMYADNAYMETLWSVLGRIQQNSKVRFDPYYLFEGNKIAGKRVTVTSKKPVYRGLIHTRKKGARNILITKEGAPKGRAYGLGQIIGTGMPPEQLTFADVEWSVANGDPADKPLGQDWIDLPGTTCTDEYTYNDTSITDPVRLLEKTYEDLQKQQRPKVTGSANIADMEWLPEYRHRIIRMYDAAVVRTEGGETVETYVVNIERHYVRRDDTIITLGDEDEAGMATLESEMLELLDMAQASGVGAGRAGAAAGEARQLLIEATELIQLNSQRIEANAQAILLRATTTDVLNLEQQTLVQFNEVYGMFDAVNAQIELKADQTLVDNIGNEVSSINATLTIQAGQISAKVDKNGIISSINQTAEEIKISAARIDLEGYVTADELEATNAAFTNLTSGMTTAQVLKSNLMEAETTNTTYLTTSSLKLANVGVQIKRITMGDLLDHRFLTETAATGDISLQHSHEVTVDDDGKITLGEVSSSGGSFNIAETRTYREGVSAARNGVTLSSAGWINGVNTVTASNGKTLTVELPEFKTSGGTAFNAEHKTTVYFYTDSVGMPLLSAEVDATSVYEAGMEAGGSYDEGFLAGFNDAFSKTTVHYSNFTITNTAANTFNATVRIYARIDGTNAASATATHAQTINVGQ